MDWDPPQPARGDAGLLPLMRSQARQEWPLARFQLCTPRTLAAATKFCESISKLGVPGSSNAAILGAVGISSLSNCRRLAAISTLSTVTPVTLPPGLLRLETRPMRTGSL